MILNSIPFVGFVLLLLILFTRIIYLRKRGIQLRSQAENKNKVSKFLLPLFSLIILIWIFEIVKPVFLFKINVFPLAFTKMLFEYPLLNITGSLLILVSLVLWTITLLNFKTSLRFGLDKNNRGKLITTGIFTYSRNPFFLSIDIYIIGISLVLPSLFFLIFAAITIVSIHFFVLKEEGFMAENYGEEYREYRKNTRRYL